MPAKIIASLTVGACCGAALGWQAAAQAGAAVSIANFAFAPATLTAPAGTPVTWTNNDSAPHQVVVSGKPLKTPVLNKGQSGQLSFADKGSYDYVCGIHPNMKGRVVVQ